MSDPAKYGAPLTGSDWVGLPLRIGHFPARGRVEDLLGDHDSVLVWSGGPSQVSIEFDDPKSGQPRRHDFERLSGMIDLLPEGTRMRSIDWEGKASTCTSVSLPSVSLAALGDSPFGGLNREKGPQFGLVDAHVVDLVLRLQEQAEGTVSLGAIYVQSLSLALASYVAARFGKEAELSSPRRAGSLTSRQRADIERFVEQNMESNFGLVDLAALLGYSPDHFSRLFKQTFQQSPYQYVLSRRIDRAMAMLHDPALGIAEIAAACGFADQGHLTKAFKQRIGITPGTYRKG